MTSTTQPRRERARPMSPEERRAEIIAATLPLFEEHGAATTTRQIADAAGVAEGTIFRVFEDKRELFHAVCEDVLNPADGRVQLQRALAGCPDLRSKVLVATERLAARNQRVMTVMMALRGAFPTEGPGSVGRPGPPAFVRVAHEQLLTDLVDLVFTPHADQLRIAPERAALVLRALVLGTWHPGLTRAKDDEATGDTPDTAAAMGPHELADVLLDGIGR